MAPNDFEITALTDSMAKPKTTGNRSWIKWLFFLAVFFVIVGGIFFILGRSSFSESKVDFKIEGPAEVASGDQVVYKISYANHNKIAIKDLRLAFFYPEDSVVIQNGQRKNFLTDNLKLNDLGPGQEGSAELSVYLIGSRGDIKDAKATLIYSPENVQSTFKKSFNLPTNISSTSVSLTLVAPPNTVSGQEVSYLLDYRNESQQDINNLRLVFSYSDGFIPSQVSPPASSGRDTWNISQIKQGDGQRITVSGILRGTEKDSKQVSVVLQRKIGDMFIDYEKASSTTVISTPPLSTQITVNDKADYTAQAGDELNYQIKFNNNTNVDLLGLTVSAKLDGSMFDLATVFGDGFFDSVAKTITWNASVSSLLNKLAPHQEGAVNFKVKLKSSFPSFGLGAKDFVVKVSVLAKTSTVPTGFDLSSLTAESELVTKIGSLPTLSQSVYSQDSSFSGSGPIPPKANKKTFYTVSWQISNNSGDFSKTRVTGILTAGVNWENQTRISGQQSLPVFKSGSRQVVWDIGSLPSGVGGQFPKYQAWFLVSLTPSGNQVGSTVKLLRGSALEGEDSFTKQAILVKVDDITTNDLTDFPGQGTIVE